MKLLLVDTDSRVAEAWRNTFGAGEGIQISNAEFTSLLGIFDCIVSPANSFGLVDGGIDAAIIDFFVAALEERVQDEI